MFKTPLIVAALVTLVAAGSASATLHNYNFGMDGLQEVPPVATPATGSCLVTLDDVSNNFTVNCTFQNLIGTSNNAHIHGPALPGVSAGVLVGLAFSPGVTSGTITGAGTLSALNTQRVLDGLTYINLHSSFRPGGEIRGQITPEPSTALLLGLGGLLVARRRRGR